MSLGLCGLLPHSLDPAVGGRGCSASAAAHPAVERRVRKSKPIHLVPDSLKSATRMGMGMRSSKTTHLPRSRLLEIGHEDGDGDEELKTPIYLVPDSLKSATRMGRGERVLQIPPFVAVNGGHGEGIHHFSMPNHHSLWVWLKWDVADAVSGVRVIRVRFRGWRTWMSQRRRRPSVTE